MEWHGTGGPVGDATVHGKGGLRMQAGRGGMTSSKGRSWNDEGAL